MATQKRYTVSTKINERENLELNALANRENISVTAIFKLFVDALLNGDIELEKGELKMCTPPLVDCVSDDFDIDYFGRRVEKEFNTLREREYPEDVINMMKDEIIAGIRTRIDMLPKKYDRRKIRDFDGGC